LATLGPNFIKAIQNGQTAEQFRAAEKAAFTNNGGCAPGKNCLETEALSELVDGKGIQFPPTTKALLDGIRSKIKDATDMVDAANTAAALGNENGVFGISSIFVEKISDLGSSIGQVPQQLQDVWGDGSFIDAIEGHMNKIMPTDLSKFAENFGEIESAVAKASESMHNAVQGAKETLGNPLEKVAGQFANMASGDLYGATFGAAASQLKGLGNLPLESGASALLETVQNFPSVKSAALSLFGTLDLGDFTDSQSESLLSSITKPADLEFMRKALGVAGKGGSAADFLNKAIASKGAINDGTFNNYVKSFAGDFGALANEGIVALGEAAEGLEIPSWSSGFGSPPSGSAKVSRGAVSNITNQFGGGSGDNGAISFKDLMGSVMGPNEDGSPSEFEQALAEYQAALSGNSKIFQDIKNACYGDWSGTSSSSDGETLETGIGANPLEIEDSSANAFHLNGALHKLLPDAISGSNTGADAAAAKVAAIMQKETDAWAKMGLSLSEAPKALANVQALAGFASSLSSKMNIPATKAALGNMLSGAAKSLGNSAPFEKALQNTVGTASTNQITPKTS